MPPPLAHHAGEDSIVEFLLTLGGSGLSVLVAVGRERAAAFGARILRRKRAFPES